MFAQYPLSLTVGFVAATRMRVQLVQLHVDLVVAKPKDNYLLNSNICMLVK